MALFKILKGLKNNLPSTKKDGYCYFTTDDQMFYIDYLDNNNVLQRKPLNANDAITLLGKGVVESLTNDTDNLPTASAVYLETSKLQTAVDTKMDKNNPVGTGTFNFNTSGATGSNAVAFGGHAEGSNSFAFGNQSRATGDYSFACGYNAKATENYSYCGGRNNEASGSDSHAEGLSTLASGQGAHSEGIGTTASGQGSHAEGNDTVASGVYSHAEGSNTIASGFNSHTSGFGTTAKTKSQFVIGEFNLFDSKTNQSSRGDYVFIIGKGTADDARSNAMTVDWSGNIHGANRLSHGAGHTVSADGAYAGGSSNTASGAYSHAEGAGTTASGTNSHSEGNTTSASGTSSHAEGEQTEATAFCAHAEGNGTVAQGNQSHAEGNGTTASGISSHVEGEGTSATKQASHAEGSNTTADGLYSHAEGRSTNASNTASHAEGQSTEASGDSSHAEGVGTIASNLGSHAEGHSTNASGEASHAEGRSTGSSGNYSHAEGNSTTSFGESSHAGGENSVATGKTSFVHGYFLRAQGENQAIFGKFNSSNATDIFQIGGGNSDTDRFNAFSITSLGDAKIKSSLNIGGAEDTTGRANLLYVSGDSYIEGGVRAGSNYYPTENKDLVTKDYVVNNLPQLTHVYVSATTEGQASFDFSDKISSLENFYLVYFNGLLLIEDIHYTVNGAVVNLLDWTARANDICHVVGLMPLNPDTNASSTGGV